MNTNILAYLNQTFQKFPNNIAIDDNESDVSFFELNELSNKIASVIASKFNLNRKPIGVFLPKSRWSVCAFLGICKSGNFYVPLDTKSPLERISKILDNLKTQIRSNLIKNFKEENRPSILADGGIRNPRDLAKAIASGADGVICGRIFAGLSDAVDEENIIEKDGKRFAVYRGMASKDVVEDYELYDGIPAMSKWVTVHNQSGQPVKVDQIISEYLGIADHDPYGGYRNRDDLKVKPNIHFETDYAFRVAWIYSDKTKGVSEWSERYNFTTDSESTILAPHFISTDLYAINSILYINWDGLSSGLVPYDSAILKKVNVWIKGGDYGETYKQVHSFTAAGLHQINATQKTTYYHILYYVVYRKHYFICPCSLSVSPYCPSIKNQ